MQDASPALSARSLACRRGDRLLFRGLDLALGPGEALHVTGANGSGKTTLIRALAGLTRPFAGTIENTGAIGLLDERAALDPDLALGEAMRFWDRIDQYERGDTGRGNDAIGMLGLDGLRDVPVRYLSTGQRKRAAMAVLIGRDAAIWLLDEPLSGLDAAGIDLMIDRVADHLARGRIALIASHQPLAIRGLKTLAIADYTPAAGHVA